MSRIANAFRALAGRLPSEYVRWDDITQIQRQVLDWEATITVTLEKLNAYYARERKRQKRENERLAEALEVGAPAAPVATPALADRKAELRRRVFAGAPLLKKGVTPPPQAGGLPDVNVGQDGEGQP